MSTVETHYEHIVLDDNDAPIIQGTNMKVIELVLDHIAYGWSPEELKYQHPYLTLGQVHSALAYYYDHQAEMDEQIERDLQEIEEIRKTLKPTTKLDERLRAKRASYE